MHLKTSALVVLIALSALGLVACQPAAEDELPTAAVRPSATPEADASPTTDLNPTEPPAIIDPNAEEGTVPWVISVADNVDARACPDTTCETLATFAPGDTVQVRSVEPDWYRVVLADGREAYLPHGTARLLEADEPGPALSTPSDEGDDDELTPPFLRHQTPVDTVASPTPALPFDVPGVAATSDADALPDLPTAIVNPTNAPDLLPSPIATQGLPDDNPPFLTSPIPPTTPDGPPILPTSDATDAFPGGG